MFCQDFYDFFSGSSMMWFKRCVWYIGNLEQLFVEKSHLYLTLSFFELEPYEAHEGLLNETMEPWEFTMEIPPIFFFGHFSGHFPTVGGRRGTSRESTWGCRPRKVVLRLLMLACFCLYHSIRNRIRIFGCLKFKYTTSPDFLSVLWLSNGNPSKKLVKHVRLYFRLWQIWSQQHIQRDSSSTRSQPRSAQYVCPD